MALTDLGCVTEIYFRISQALEALGVFWLSDRGHRTANRQFRIDLESNGHLTAPY